MYMEAPPVPDKKYDLDEGSNTVGVGGAAASAGVMLVVDENAQDSGSGYSAVTDLESAAQPSSGDIDLPGMSITHLFPCIIPSSTIKTTK